MPAPPGKELIPVTDELVARITSLMYKGKSLREVGKELGLSHNFIATVYKRPEVSGAFKRHIQLEIAKRSKELVDALFEQVKEGNVQAIRTGFQVMGSLEHEPTQVTKSDSSITVVLPGAVPAKPEPKDIEHETD